MTDYTQDNISTEIDDDIQITTKDNGDVKNTIQSQKQKKHAEIYVLEDLFGPIKVIKNHKISDLYLVSQVKLKEEGVLKERILKILRKPKHIHNKDYKDAGKRFQRETVYGELLSSNNNSFISVIDFSTSPIPFILMEYASGGNLREKINQPKNRQEYNLSDILGWTYYAARALDFAHSIRLIHRDIKPENILLTKKGQVRIGDTGLVRPLSLWGYGLEKKFVGTPVYASPEQFEEDPKKIDHRTDIYSFGLVVCELLTKTNPLNPKEINLNNLGRKRALEYLKSNANNIENILQGKIKDVPSIKEKAKISDDLDNIIKKCLNPYKKKRYPYFSCFIEDLKKTEEYMRTSLPKS